MSVKSIVVEDHRRPVSDVVVFPRRIFLPPPSAVVRLLPLWQLQLLLRCLEWIEPSKQEFLEDWPTYSDIEVIQIIPEFIGIESTPSTPNDIDGKLIRVPTD